MNTEITVGIILFLMGIFFFFNSKNMSKGASAFYRKLYTEKNLKIIFKIMGVILVVGSFLLIFVN